MTHATPEARADMEWHLSIEQRALAWNRAETVKQLQDDFKRLTHEQQWDLLNVDYFDPETFRAIQQETKS